MWGVHRGEGGMCETVHIRRMQALCRRYAGAMQGISKRGVINAIIRQLSTPTRPSFYVTMQRGDKKRGRGLLLAQNVQCRCVQNGSAPPSAAPAAASIFAMRACARASLICS